MVSNRVKAFREHQAKQAAEEQALKAKLETEFAEGWGPATKKAVWNYAWEEGHSSGYSEVRIYYENLAGVVNTALSEKAS